MTECSPDLKECWKVRDDLSVENCSYPEGTSTCSPTETPRANARHHSSGASRNREMYSQGQELPILACIHNDIEDMTARCQTCMLFSKLQPKQPLHPHSVPSFPCQKLGSDLCEFKGHQYLLVTEYYSRFPVIRKLTSTASSSIINVLISLFTEHRIPEELVTDNGPQ